jgi:hypothetical protein
VAVGIARNDHDEEGVIARLAILVDAAGPASEGDFLQGGGLGRTWDRGVGRRSEARIRLAKAAFEGGVDGFEPVELGLEFLNLAFPGAVA